MKWTTKAGLRLKIKEMELDRVYWDKRTDQWKEHQERMAAVAKDKEILNLKDSWRVETLKNQAEVSRLREKAEQLEKRVAEAPYALLSDLLKALLVKFPTMDIKDLAITVKEKGE